ncbi:DNA-binding transcriptional ArsR family regulator [Streptomyces sp. V4I23]|uniref:ArsR/SmtB family transcription factor n=1 Tax=Streptomyces sp. V4I23 TaxID=3042282 RepID=UPI0027899956|nr:winged helix-turn-helix domain-containing protein [Streptomyces sp. V4I23]MDQ1010513.1 DNA-binding transcriptional ArsR family regulator [Streptomyces sp. V4I23]
MSEPPAPKVRTLDPHSLRGLAHPLRMRLLSSLRHDGPATASQLAEKFGESSGATSYHLRQLAAHGFVEDDPGRGKGRERWWKAAEDGTRFDDTLFADPDPAVRGAADLFIHEVATQHTQEVATWLGTRRDWPEEWRRGSDLSDFTLRLTAAQAVELNEKIHALIQNYRDLAPPPGTEGVAQVRLHTHAFPRATD